MFFTSRTVCPYQGLVLCVTCHTCYLWSYQARHRSQDQTAGKQDYNKTRLISIVPKPIYVVWYRLFGLGCLGWSIRNQPKIIENTSLAAKGAIAHRLQRRTACNVAPPATPHPLLNPKWTPGAPKWPWGSGNVSILKFLGAPANFRKISFLLRALHLWEKVATEGGKNGSEKKTDDYSGH